MDTKVTEVKSEAEAQVQPVECPTLEQVVVSSEGSLCWGSPSLGVLYPVEGTHAETVHEELEAFRNDLCWRGSWRTISHGRDLALEQSNSVRSPPLEKEGVAETLDELIPILFLIPCTTGWEDVENSGVMLSPGRRGGGRKGVFKLWLYCSLSYSDLINNELN